MSKNIITIDINSEREKPILINKPLLDGPESEKLLEAEGGMDNMVKKDIKVKAGIDKDTSKIIMKLIKDSKLKVSAAMMDETIRVTAKKIDDLQEVIALMRSKSDEIGMPLQFVNMKS